MADTSLTSSNLEHNLASPVRSGDHQDDDEEDDIQISLAPYIQSYLAQTGRRISCFGIGLPVPFERAAQRSWWDPRFDSEILEGQYRTSSFPQVQLRFQFALIYILVSSLTWFVYFLSIGLHGLGNNWGFMPASFIILFFSNLAFLILTYTEIYRQYTIQVSLSVAVLNSVVSLLFAIVYPGTSQPDISPVGQFTMAVITLLITYTVIPLPLYMCVIIGTLYSILFESLTTGLTNNLETTTMQNNDVLVRAFLHVCVHCIGIHILIMTNVRMRGTFMKVGQSLLVRRQLEKEKSLKEKMIFSVMPPKVARWLINEGGGQDNEDAIRGNDIRSLFRPFNMVRMENVSILFADIVGFTRMSSNKSAEELVGILNDLFERFDELCVSNGCEKISTLGDCYYCVSGCPEPRVEHAKSCVEMGLGMIGAIQQFDVERNEGVTMRVGVHTGTVLCGIVGTKRFKFDVWSNDVTLANQMESSGKPGQVHISQATMDFLGEDYLMELGENVHGIKTYFIVGRKKVLMSATDLDHTTIKDTKLITPSSSPSRPRVSSFNQGIQNKSKRPHYLQLLASPSTQNKATSMPSMLESDREQLDGNGDRMKTMIVKSGGSSASCGRFSPKSSAFRKFSGKNRRKSETMPLGASSPMLKRTHAESIQDLLVSPLNVPSPIEDRLSVCRSSNSRKDSGIRSNSHRSSIQHQIFAMNGLTQGEILNQRVSGYYTSSQSSFDEADSDIRRSHLPPPLGENFGACFQKLRKQSDLQLIRCVQDNVTSHRSYFVKPPLSDLSLFFRQPEMELEYRANAHRGTEKHGNLLPTLATSRFNTYFDVVISALVYSAVSASLFVLYEASTSWIVIYVLASMIHLFAIYLCFRQLLRSKLTAPPKPRDLAKRVLDRFSTWYPWHVCGAILVSLPVVAILCNFTCPRILGPSKYTYSYLMFVGLVHFCNFTQLNCWMKSSIATITGILYVLLVTTQTCQIVSDSTSNVAHSKVEQIISTFGQNRSITGFENSTLASNSSAIVLEDANELNASSSIPAGVGSFLSVLNGSLLENGTEVANSTAHLVGALVLPTYETELIVDVVLILLLVWFLNREFEISYRLSFHSNFVAVRDKSRVQSMKNQADGLLHNIIPKHVADQLKNTAKYSENHKDVGVIFASIVNFNEMYDESFMGGREFLRVLNELIGDFDELLTKPEFGNVEKIKTIGSTFMAASGLNPAVRKLNIHPNQHLFELMDFAMALQKVVDDFNQDLLEFALVLRIGYNFGDVTSGVIGTSKLYYDIWGDAVNIASRMDSTGVCGKIQVGGSCVESLSERFEFEPRGSVYVKGKDNMNVFLLVGKRGDSG